MGELEKQIDGFLVDPWPHGGITLEHVEVNPKHFETKTELRRYLKEKKLSSGALL